MRISTKLLIGVGAYAAIMVTNFYVQRNAGLQRAISLSGKNGVVNIGSGVLWSNAAKKISELPEVKANVDVDPLSHGCPNYQKVDLDLGGLPFIDGQFDVAFASHVLEHLHNWQTCLHECVRVANHVIIVLPNPFSINSYFNSLHLQHFTFADMAAMRKQYDEVEVFA